MGGGTPRKRGEVLESEGVTPQQMGGEGGVVPKVRGWEVRPPPFLRPPY